MCLTASASNAMRPPNPFLILQRASMESSTRLTGRQTISRIDTRSPIRRQSRHVSSVMQSDQHLQIGRGVSFRLMPLGGSVTQGVGSSTRTGYRRPLLRMLQDHGFDVQMVGSRKTGSMHNKDHEGWPGLRIDEIDKKARLSTPRLLPHVFAINAGSNDCLQSFKLGEAGDRLGNMLEYLWQASPHSTMLLSTLIVSADKKTNSNVMRVNDQIRALAKQKANEHRKLVLVDMNCEAGPEVGCLVDGVHPNDEGYEKMAKLWVNGTLEALQKGFLQKAIK
ncbi:SGNH hydrolase-type esterase domain-containing protein [Xylaria digitata]|nr:SGNH hydrolase-type esterase domain-containing protein [Xylaria digitata]